MKMKKFELIGILSAAVFAICGLNENGLYGYIGVFVFGLISFIIIVLENENKRKSYLRARKSLIRANVKKRLSASF